MQIKATEDSKIHIDFADRFRQPLLFEGMNIGKMYPTDIDAMTEYHDRLFIFMEVKYGDTPTNYGQFTALERTASALQETGRDAIVLICRHSVEDRTKPVLLKDTIVTNAFYKGEWYDADTPMTAGDTWKNLMNWAIRKENGYEENSNPF